MPTFKFEFHTDPGATGPQYRGFPNLDAARRVAQLSARFIIAERIRDDGRLNLDHRIDIASQDGRLLDSVEFCDAIEIEGLKTPLRVD